ncbi:ATP-binding protein [Oleiphilus sp. HI0125]|uniref:AAA family ATPase n=1 Tax=Oleiphilus sp. HI0125 TaxID=1822266 RepID=UPI000AE144F8|nr:ATP-binding protein [Oleiphilus sp. HI0125]
MKKGTSIFFCRKMGAGNSTKAREIAHKSNAVLLSEDEWLASLCPNKISSLNDYIEYSNLLKSQLKKLVQTILSTGINVVMNFPANTLSQRARFRSIFAVIDAPHNLIYVDLSNAECLK